MPMKKPVHPGSIVKHECLEPLNLTVKRAAEILGVSRQALNNVINEKAAIRADMAIRLEKAFGSTAHTWLQMQTNYVGMLVKPDGSRRFATSTNP